MFQLLSKSAGRLDLLSTLWRHGNGMTHVIDKSHPDLGGNIRHGDLASFTPTLWKFIIERYGIESMLDVGAGEGHAVKWFNRAGVWAHGFDGLPMNVQRAVCPISHHDLKRGPFMMPVDLVLCVEVVEHIEEMHIDNLMKTLANGRVVMMTHAVPGQSGYHHVNCQPEAYWQQKMSAAGYEPSIATNVMREIASRDGWDTYFEFTGLVFLRR